MGTPDNDVVTGSRSYIPLRCPISDYAMWPWEGTFEKWASIWVRKNYWRVRHVSDSPEDALSTCKLLFCECVNRYGPTVDNPRWLMSLYSRMVINHWHRLSVLDTRQRELIVLRDDVLDKHSDITGLGTTKDGTHDERILTNEYVPSETSLIDIVLSLPDEIRRALTILMEAPAEIIDTLVEGKDEESDSQAIRRFCGIKTDLNILEEIRRALSGKMSRAIVTRNTL